MNDTMRGLFFIMKGQYSKGVGPSFVNKVSHDTMHIGGYDPYSDTTEEWYMLMDCKTYHCIACGSDFKKVLKGVYTYILKFKGEAKRYFKHVSTITSDDYYETHYLGKRPLDHDQRVKKAEGRCPRVSPIMRELYEHIYEEYGEFFSDEIERMEDLAYSDLVVETPFKKAKRLVSKTKPKKDVVKTETPKEVNEKPVRVNVKPKLGLKKLTTK